ncbi:hypothetical protein SEA_MINIFLAYER_21 [Satellite phage MiniFlayer]|nr:hypothetical protein SEA_MINIFLAYER_21 [Satellite phage MiniFlayer]
MTLNEKMERLEGFAKRLEQRKVPFESIREAVLEKAAKMNIRPVGSGRSAMDSNHSTPC